MLSDSGNTLRLRSEFAHHCYSGWRHWFRVIAAALILSGFVSGARAAEPVKPTAEAAKAAVPKEATLVVWDQPITVFRSSFAGLNARTAGGTSCGAHSGVADWD